MSVSMMWKSNDLDIEFLARLRTSYEYTAGHQNFAEHVWTKILYEQKPAYSEWSCSTNNCSYDRHATLHNRKLSMFLTFLFGLNTSSPSTIDVSVTSDGSRQGAKSAKFTYSPDFALKIVLGETLAPEGKHTCASVVAGWPPADM